MPKASSRAPALVARPDCPLTEQPPSSFGTAEVFAAFESRLPPFVPPVPAAVGALVAPPLPLGPLPVEPSPVLPVPPLSMAERIGDALGAPHTIVVATVGSTVLP